MTTPFTKHYLTEYEVVCTMKATHITRHVEAKDETQARQKVWDNLSKSQKERCENIEVFPIE